MAEAIRRMTNPTLTLFTLIVPWRNSRDLKAALSHFRDALAEIRRLDCFEGIRGGVGAIETKVTEQGSFNLHAHVVADLDHLDEADADATWRSLIQPRRAMGSRNPRARTMKSKQPRSGSFSVAPDPVPKDIDALSIYSAKSGTWSPFPGTLDLAHLRAIQRAIWRRQLLIKWGTAIAPKVARPSY